MSYFKRAIATPLATLSLLLLTACGGGGGSTPEPTPPATGDGGGTTTPPPQTVEHQVTVVDGYLENARVFVDLNGDYRFDEVEPNGMTNADGVVTLDLTGIDNALQMPIIAEAIAGQTIDKSTNTAVLRSFAMAAPEASAVVSPLTHTLQAAWASGDHADLAAATAEVKTQMGLTAEHDLQADYLNADSASPYLHAIARNLVQLLPESADMTFTGENVALYRDQLMTGAGRIAEQVALANGQDIDLDTLFVEYGEDLQAVGSAISLDDVKDYAGEVSQWGGAVATELANPNGIVVQAIAAQALLSTDMEDMSAALSRFAESAVEAALLGNFEAIDPSTVIEGANGTISMQLGDDGMVTVEIDASYEDIVVKATITFDPSETPVIRAKVAGSLESTLGKIELIDESQILVDAQTRHATSFLFIVIATSKLNPLVNFAGNLSGDMTLLGQGDDAFSVPHQMDFHGLLTSSNLTVADVTMKFTGTPALVNGALVYTNVRAELVTDIDFPEQPDATMAVILHIEDTSSPNLGDLEIRLSYGDREIVITTNNPGESGQVMFDNQKGIVITIDLFAIASGDNLGQVVAGAKQVGHIERQNGKFVIVFSDGTTQELF